MMRTIRNLINNCRVVNMTVVALERLFMDYTCRSELSPPIVKIIKENK